MARVVVAMWFVVLASACAQGKAVGADADAGVIDRADADHDRADGGPDVDASQGGGEITLTQSSSTTIVNRNSVGCLDDFGDSLTASYYRVFDLPAIGITDPLSVSGVSVGIEKARVGSGSDQGARVRLHTLSGDFHVANLTEIASTNIRIQNQNLTVLDVPISATVPGGSTLVVEFVVPDGSSKGNLLMPGSNAETETGPTYMRAGACDVTQPTEVADLGAPKMHWVLSVAAQQ